MDLVLGRRVRVRLPRPYMDVPVLVPVVGNVEDALVPALVLGGELRMERKALADDEEFEVGVIFMCAVLWLGPYVIEL